MKVTDKGVLFRIFSVALLIFAVLGFAGCGEDYSRAQFRKMVMDQPEAEVRKQLGDPTEVKNGPPKIWIYYRRTYDAKNQNKDDYRAVLTFGLDKTTGQEKVISVTFQAHS